MYVQLYLEKDTELQYLNGNIIPEKDKLIEDQKNEIINLIGECVIITLCIQKTGRVLICSTFSKQLVSRLYS